MWQCILEIPRTRSSHRTVDASSGYNTSMINAGKVRNNGVEVELNAKPIVSVKGF